MMKVAVGSDHGGFQLKTVLVGFLKETGHEVLDLGIHRPEASDYPDAARAVSEAVLGGEAERGILVCGSGVGASVAANKFPGIRASLCHDTFSARQGVEDDDMNVICLGERVIGAELAKEIVRAFLSARFSGEERFRRRLEKVKQIEKEFMKRGA
jgi:ribose 5-phosphate isomerase B